MPTAINLTPIRRRLSDCLGIYPAITKILRRRWDDGDITTTEMDAVLEFLLDTSTQMIVYSGKDPCPIERALRDRHLSKGCTHDS